VDHLSALENQSIFILREAYKKFDNIAMLWSMGKDSTVLLWLARKAFLGQVPFQCAHIDTTHKFKEMYAYREKFAKEWNLNLFVGVNQDAIDRGINYENNDPITVCHEMKTVALQQFIEKEKWNGLIVGIRRDEDGTRAKEKFFSPRNIDFEWDYKDQPPELWNQFQSDYSKDMHVRIHPLLEWTEIDVWNYIKRENIPVVDLYYAKNGKRYRTLGCQPITKPVDSDADTIDKIIAELKDTKISERAGRGQDHSERYAMQKLRAKGYM
jgi:sulfate adenylyltransferase subunit 2